MCPGRIGCATYTNNDGVRTLITLSAIYALVVKLEITRRYERLIAGSSPAEGAIFDVVSTVGSTDRQD